MTNYTVFGIFHCKLCQQRGSPATEIARSLGAVFLRGHQLTLKTATDHNIQAKNLFEKDCTQQEAGPQLIIYLHLSKIVSSAVIISYFMNYLTMECLFLMENAKHL